MPDDRDLEAALAAFGRFMDRGPLTTSIAELEKALEGCSRAKLDALVDAHGVSIELFAAARFIRDRIGRINDLIHAAAIVLALRHLLDDGEVLKRPSLAAGNDPTRPFDVETDRRVAEFKLARWDGHDAMRKRQVFKDFVFLAADRSGRSAELYVLGARPIRFLATSTSKASWALDRAPAARDLVESNFGSLDQSIAEFVASTGARVKVYDLEKRLPELFAAA